MYEFYKKEGLKPLKSIFSPRGASRTSYIVLAGVLSVPFTLSIVWLTDRILGIYFDTSIAQILDPRGAWTLITLIFSSPVAFFIWYFRDENAKEQIENHRQQVENQRKDVNLKEFQKIAEWVSGFHFDEDKNEEDNKNKEENKNESIDEITDENRYNNFDKKISTFATYSKRDGAIALQVSSVYSLQPFLHGDYGEYFIIPAFNLLKQSLQILHYHDMKKLDFYYGKECYDKKYKDVVFNIRQRARGAMGIALAQVLLAENNKYLSQQSDSLSLLCLSGIDFNLFGLRENIKEDFFYKLKNITGIRLSAAILNEVNFIECNMTKADFRHADLYKSYFYKGHYNSIYFNFANLDYVEFRDINIKYSNFTKSIGSFTKFINCDLQENNMQKIELMQAYFIKCKLNNSNFNGARLSNVNFYKSNMESVNLSKSNLHGVKFKSVNLDYINLQEANIFRTSFIEVDKMHNANLVNVEHVYLKEFINIKYISGSIIDFRDEFYNEDVDILKLKGMIFLVGKRIEILIPYKIPELLISSQKFGVISHTHKIFSFEIDLKKTEEFNPDWSFILT